ncbi:TetR/AcrR family transcriptional regulator [Streptomyces sp. DW26H14]
MNTSPDDENAQAAEPEAPGGQDAPGEPTESAADGKRAAGYRRSAGSPRGEARRRELLDLVTDDLAANGLVDFSLRRAARAAGTTHKVLLYHFDGIEDLLRQAVHRLRGRRIDNEREAVAAIGSGGPESGRESGREGASAGSLAEKVRAVWPILTGEEPGLRRVLDQAMGLAMYDNVRHRALGREASRQYLPLLMSFCPERWPERRRFAVAEMILATLRGFLLERLIGEDASEVGEGFEALIRMLEREEAAPDA